MSTAKQLTIDGVVPPQSDLLDQIVKLSKRLTELDTEIEEHTKRLAEATETRKDIAERLLPDLLDSVGMSEFTLVGGQKIKLKTDYFANISKDRADAAFHWLREHNMGGMIKEIVTVSKDNKDGLIEAKIPFTTSETVHPMALKALAREQITSGQPFPADIFGVHIAQKVVVE